MQIPVPVQADGIVTDCSNDTQLSNQIVLGGTITFNCGSGPHIIILSSTKNINSDTSLQGGGLITLSGANALSLFQVSVNQTLSLSDITLTKGKDTAGGAIQNFGTLVITNTQIVSNTATDSGGAIYNSGQMMISHSIIADNVATNNGGGIYDTGGQITMTASQVYGNLALFGGGMQLGGTATILSSQIHDNTSAGGSGGIFAVSTAQLTVSNSQVSSNTSTNGHGGGIRSDGILAVTNSTFSHNRALGGLDGGAIDNLGQASLSDTTIYSNVATETGGGIFNGGSLSVTNSTLSENFGYQGGALGNYGIMTLTGVSLVNNVGQFGGGLYNTIGAAALTNVTISGNHAVPDGFNHGGLGGGIFDGYPDGNGIVYLTNVSIVNNSATKNGGGLYFTTPNTATLTNSIVAYSPAGDNCYGSTFPSPLTVASDGFNLSSDNTCTLFGTRDQLNTDPLLARLAYYGGPTLTHLPLLGSPALDNAQCLLGVPTDQRGIVRPQGSSCDIGSVERQASDRGYWVFAPFIVR